MIEESEVFAHALALSEDSRALLAKHLIESLGPLEKEPGYDEAWAAEIERRCLEVDEGKVELFTWEEVKEKILKSLSSKVQP